MIKVIGSRQFGVFKNKRSTWWPKELALYNSNKTDLFDDFYRDEDKDTLKMLSTIAALYIAIDIEIKSCAFYEKRNLNVYNLSSVKLTFDQIKDTLDAMHILNTINM